MGVLKSLRGLTDRALGQTGAWVDRLAVDLALEVGRARTTAPERDVVSPATVALLSEVAEAHADPSLYAMGGFFAAPPPPEVYETRLRGLDDGGAVYELATPSAFVPFAAAERDSFLAFEENRVATARALLHPTPRAAVLCVHGYLGGHLGFEEAAFSASKLYAWGLDVVLVNLPFHGARTPARKTGMWPGRNPWWTVSGFGQAVWDLARWRHHLRARGASRVGLFGMSLGGYTAALAVTAHSGWDFVVPMIPLASLAEVYAAHREGRPDAPPAWFAEHLDAAYRVVSPFARAPQIAPSAALVIAAEGDQITPVHHARRISAHLGATYDTFPGGHLFQARRDRAFASLEQFLERRGLIAPR
ncbi:MAG: prolyl oligopeptidase family serine peptidase [Myxococcales bacterium]|nr:prolyl oligopeptidase family serine peptidase [Myxococcales bacterium]